jgi:uracil-DNA glycosylase family 4
VGEERLGTPHWGRPVYGFGDEEGALVVVGLAPAAQGANRTGRVFTGDRSARFLVAALHKAGFANQPTSEARGDGLEYRNAFITLGVRCVPPDNQPTPLEIRRCQPYLVEEFRLLRNARVFLALGRQAFDQTRRALEELHPGTGRPPPFQHGLRFPLGEGRPVLWASYHPSPRNVQTGLLREESFLSVLRELRADLGPGS